MNKHRQKTNRRKTAGVAAIVVAAAAVGIPSVALASGGGQGGWRSAAFSWWGWGTSGPAAGPTPAGSASTSAAGTSGTAAASSIPSVSRSGTAPSTSPSASASPTAKPAVSTPGTSASPSSTAKATSSGSDPSASADSADSGPTDRVLALVNAEREKAGCAALTENAKLTKAAQDHSQDMADHTNMSHTGSDGSSMTDRLARVGYSFSSAGENVAAGYTTPESVMAGWMSSAGHKANILNCGFKEIGIGLAQPGNYWTQDFGSAL
ncbi:CAP domain-containing protein [Streptomyces sp. NBC_01537]